MSELRQQTSKDGPVPAVSANSRIYTQIKERILINEFPSGYKLNHKDLATQFSVSRTPIREALERLYQEGYIVHYPNKGFFVAEIDEIEIKELFEVREALELYALRQCKEQNMQFDLNRLQKIIQTSVKAVKEGHPKQQILLDREFHMALAAHCENDYLLHSLEGIFERIFLKLRVEGYVSRRGKEAHDEHVRLFESLSKRNFNKIENLLSANIRSGYIRIMGQI